MDKASKKENILVVDDSQDTIEIIQRNLSAEGYPVSSAFCVSDALEILDTKVIDLVITDYRMPGTSGFELVRHVRDNCRNTGIIMVTGYATINGAVEAIKNGAEGYLAKPFTDEELILSVEKALQKLRHSKIVNHDTDTGSRNEQFGIIGESRAMQDVYKPIRKSAGSIATVLVTGESGTGKELVARAIHYHSARASKAFVPVNCGGIPDGLLESELFGHVKGSFTGATGSRAGFFQTADGGTIFLDEISELSMHLQVKLLRVLQDKEVRMIGSNRSIKVDIKIIAATNRDLQALVKSGKFREDLFFRLNVLTISVPALRDRGDDILLLIKHFAQKSSREMEKPAPVFSDNALQALKSYSWPGNVRELENIITRLIVMTDSDRIESSDLPSLMRFSPCVNASEWCSLAELETEHIRRVLEGVQGNKSKAAQILGIDRKTLREKIKRNQNND